MKSQISSFSLKLFVVSLFGVSLLGCDLLQDVKEINGSCTIVLVDGSSVVSNGNIEILEKTQTITYRDDSGKIWSLFKDEYTSYTCE
ncbi:hypothetical protein [Algoriphagus aquimarinus]|uniref:Lipoprotein n=1 Tax=Algoriphagus aquimarinus TaxID=237018 RepID=A0A1I1B9T8_9BACT|nr:hypothetical protein [Algoriphagus aquimarinus]SFB47109.1 hypothetical protein SAMN04489723_1129 [Algoriphagus aquimarinus]